MADFEKEYKKLNVRQREAVDQIDGPLLVVAGPGTGKTQLLSLRVANILKVTDTSPENILCLTFTNKAANNMRERLSSLVGPTGNRVPIRTFHSFAAELMTTYPDYFWNGARLTHVPDAVQLEIITDILGELPLHNPLALKFAGNFTATGDVKDGLRLAKEAGLTPDKLRSLIELNQRYIDVLEPELVEICSTRLNAKKLDELAAKVDALPDQQTDTLTRPLISLTTVIKESFETARTQDDGTGKTTALSKWKARWISTVNGEKGMFDERKRNDWWLALTDVYDTYRNFLHQRGYYDYADMIIEVIAQLEHRSDMRSSVQEHYHYVLIDEFQDTNAAQLRLAHLVADHYTANGQPNIMAVGDDDQAIYKFNGAELSNMLDFKRSYPESRVVVLDQNYRSSQAILDFGGKLIDQATERLTDTESELKKSLVATAGSPQQGIIEHLSYPTKLHQYHNLAKKIAAVQQKGETVAILARTHDSLRSLAAILQEQKIPLRYEQQQSIMEQPAVNQIILIAEIVDALEKGEASLVNERLATLLRHPVWDINPQTLWQLAIANRYARDWISSLLESEDIKLQNIAHWLLWLSRESAHQPLPRLLEYIIGLKPSEHLTSPIREYFLALSGVSDNQIDTPLVSALSGVHKLLNLAQEFCQQGQATLSDFVRLIQVAKENNQSITDESLFVSSPDAVELLTVHKAKGLEFDHVFIIDAQDTIWRPTSRGRKPPANLPLKPSGDDNNDYIRLMFVAITRAKRAISISSYYTDSNGQAVLPSGIIRDILPAQNIELSNAGTPLEVLEQALTWPRLAGSQEKLLLKNTLRDYKLSVTALLNFLDITKGGPDYFLERHLLKLPEAVTAKAAFGRACHTALERAQQLVCDNDFALDKVLTAYETALQQQYLDATDHERYLLHGQNVLRQLFGEFQLQLTANGRPEVKLADVSLGTVRLRGDLDRVDVDDTGILITDYKTGTPLHSLFTKNKTLQPKAWRHRTQLQFYSILAGESHRFKKHPAITSQMLYIEAETKKELALRYEPSLEELERLRRLIAAVWQKITSLNLPDVRHYEQNYQGIQAFEQDLLDGKI